MDVISGKTIIITTLERKKVIFKPFGSASSRNGVELCKKFERFFSHSSKEKENMASHLFPARTDDFCSNREMLEDKDKCHVWSYTAKLHVIII